MLLPMPREPEWRTTQTRSSSSRQTSTKWLPEPRVPSWRSARSWSKPAACGSGSSFSQRAALSACARRGVSLAWLVLSADAGGDGAREEVYQRREVAREGLAGPVGADGDHAAADVDADGGGDEGVVEGGYDAADGGALT